MPNLIERLFNRAGVTSVAELTPEEKITYDQLIRDLKERTKPITAQDWEKYLEEQLHKTINSFDPDSTEKKKDFMWSQAYLLEKLLVYIKGPKQEEEQIKKEYKIL